MSIYVLSRNLEGYAMINEEKIILRTGEKWKAVFPGLKHTSLILTNIRLIMPELDRDIKLTKIKDIDIEIKMTESSKIILKTEGSVDSFGFASTTSGSAFHLLLGSANKVTSEVSAYTTYWASILSMAIFIYGSPEIFSEDM